MGIQIPAMKTISRYRSRYQQLPIIPMHTEEDFRYFIFNKNNTLIGAFNFDNSGTLSNVNLDRHNLSIKTIADVLYSIEDFVVKKAKALKLKSVNLSVEASPAENKPLKKLFRRFKAQETDESITSRIHHYIRFFDPHTELEAISKKQAKPNFLANA